MSHRKITCVFGTIAIIGSSQFCFANQTIIHNNSLTTEIDAANRILAGDSFLRNDGNPRIKDILILGRPEATPQQVVNYIKSRNEDPQINCSIDELVQMYYEEAVEEGIRPDIAISQAILETGFFRYGGDVVADQNNYCGLGTTGKGVKGAWFATPREGVRAHIQHLLVYSSPRLPTKPIIDPRFHLVRSIPTINAKCTTVHSLGGKWAVPGIEYGQKIERILDEIIAAR